MRKLLVAIIVLGLTAAVGLAQEKKEPPKKRTVTKAKPAITLRVGDSAPPLKADKWLQGEEVKGFESGKIYVVEFWATWCGPCIVMMPHLAELQEQYKNKGVTIIGYSAKDNNNGEEKVTAFVKKRGPKLKYTFAYADDRETADAWMRAAGRSGIPCSFVVDKEGKIAFIGHPMYLDLVLPKVVDGTWQGKESMAEIDAIDKEVNDVFRSFSKGDAEASLKTLSSFESRHPELARVPYFVGPKLNFMLQSEKIDEARKLAQEVIDRAIKQDDPTALRTVSAAMRSSEAKEHEDLIALSVKAAEAMLTISGDQDAQALFNAAEAYHAAGQTDKAKEFAQKAIDAADSPALKRSIEQRAKKLDAQSTKDRK